MIVLITGTPGTGKTTVARLLAKMLGYRLIGINEWAGEDVVVGYDEERGSRILDMEEVSRKLQGIKENAIIEGHSSHLLSFGDVVIVLRAHPDVLRDRLGSFKEKKLRENLEAEALDVCLVESLEEYDSGKVFEIDTSRKNPEEVALDITRILEGRGEGLKPGRIDWSEEFFSRDNRQA